MITSVSITGGVVVVLGLDAFTIQIEIAKVQRVKTTDGNLQLKTLVESHFEKTGSEKAEKTLANWKEEASSFWKVCVV